MKNSLFDVPAIETKKNKPIKKIPMEKWQILCEKEALIAFLSEYIPYAFIPKRINSGRDKGMYTVIVENNDYNNSENYDIKDLKENIDVLLENWKYGKTYSYTSTFEKYYTNQECLKIHFYFSNNYKHFFIKEWVSIYADNTLLS